MTETQEMLEELESLVEWMETLESLLGDHWARESVAGRRQAVVACINLVHSGTLGDE